MAKISSKEKQQQMFALIEAWKVSGETNKNFVACQGIGLSKFQYWQKKYREQNATKGGFIRMHPSGGQLGWNKQFSKAK